MLNYYLSNGRKITSGWKSGDLVIKIDSSNADDIHLIGWVVQGTIKRSIISDRRNHYDVIGGQLPNLMQKKNVILSH